MYLETRHSRVMSHVRYKLIREWNPSLSTAHDMIQLPSDIFPLIAAQIPSLNDLKALSLTCHACCLVARRELFHNILLIAQHDESWYLLFTVFIIDNIYLVPYIRALTIRSSVPSYLSAYQPAVSMLNILPLTDRLTRLESISILACKWWPGFTPPFEAHPTLNVLHLSDVRDVHFTRGLSNLLRLSRTWSRVHLTDISNVAALVSTHVHDTVITRLTLQNNLWTTDITSIIPKIHHIRNLTSLDLYHLRYDHLTLLANALVVQPHRLSELRVQVFCTEPSALLSYLYDLLSYFIVQTKSVPIATCVCFRIVASLATLRYTSRYTVSARLTVLN